MKEKTCCFTGHREIPSGQRRKIFARTEEAIEGLIKKGYLYFGAGGALGFDTIAAFAVLKLKERYPTVYDDVLSTSHSRKVKVSVQPI